MSRPTKRPLVMTIVSRARWDPARRRWTAMLGFRDGAANRVRQVVAPKRFGHRDGVGARHWFAMEQYRRAPDLEPARGDTALILCTRIGEAPTVPSGYATADCRICKAPVWISPDVVEAIRSMGMKLAPCCTACAGGLGDVAP